MTAVTATAMHTRIAKMQEEIMEHLKQHMHMGKESVAQRPMD